MVIIDTSWASHFTLTKSWFDRDMPHTLLWPTYQFWLIEFSCLSQGKILLVVFLFSCREISQQTGSLIAHCKAPGSRDSKDVRYSRIMCWDTDGFWEIDGGAVKDKLCYYRRRMIVQEDLAHWLDPCNSVKQLWEKSAPDLWCGSTHHQDMLSRVCWCLT